MFLSDEYVVEDDTEQVFQVVALHEVMICETGEQQMAVELAAECGEIVFWDLEEFFCSFSLLQKKAMH